MRDDIGLYLLSSSGGGKMWLDSGFVLEVEPTRFAKGLALEYERKWGIKAVSQVFDLRNWRSKVAIYSFGKSLQEDEVDTSGVWGCIKFIYLLYIQK